MKLGSTPGRSERHHTSTCTFKSGTHTTHAQRERERDLDIDKDVKSPLDFKLIKKNAHFLFALYTKIKRKTKKKTNTYPPASQIVTEWPELLSRL